MATAEYTDRLVVAVGPNKYATILFVSGTSIEDECAHNRTDDFELLVGRSEVPFPSPGVWVYECQPHPSRPAEHAYDYGTGAFRAPTAAEWAAIQKGEGPWPITKE